MTAPRVTAPRTEGAEAAPATSSSVALAIAWAIVGIPAAWGVAQTVIKSLALFH